MRSKMLPVAVLAAVVASFFLASSCGNGSSVCPTCGTTSNGSIIQIDTMLVPEHNGNGEPGGPFNIFDISWVDPLNHLYYVTDRVGLDVPIFSTVTDIAVFDIGGDNSIADSGNNVSPCFVDGLTGTVIPPITNAQGNYTRFGCKTLGFRLPGGFGPNGHYGGFVGGQCCASRSNNLNPLTGPNGLEAFPDGLTVVIGNGSSSAGIFDMTQTLADIKAHVTFPTPPTVLATVVTGTSPDYDGPNGIGPCQASANGRAFSDPTCGDLRGDELATTGSTPALDPAGNPHDLLMMINGDPGLPYVTLLDITHVVRKTGTLEQQHCLPVVNQQPYSPGGPNTTFPRNFATCVLGQIYYDNALPTDSTVAVDENNGFACPDPSLQFIGTPGNPGPPVPSGASGTGVGSATHLAGINVPCHHGPMLRNGAPNTPTNGQFCPAANSFPDCFGAVGLAGLGGMVYNPNTGHFLSSNGSATTDLAVGTIAERPLRIAGPHRRREPLRAARSPIDDEALLRGTSVYFPHRAVPMLPVELSTEVCSLRPRVRPTGALGGARDRRARRHGGATFDARSDSQCGAYDLYRRPRRPGRRRRVPRAVSRGRWIDSKSDARSWP